MRNYSQKAEQYRLPKEQTAALRAFCLSAKGDDLELIRDIAWDAVNDMLAEWIVQAVTSDRWPWARLEANHIPCSQQTFRIYRMKFYFLLAKYFENEKEGHEKIPPWQDNGE